MTDADFRNSPEMRASLRALIESDAFTLARSIILGKVSAKAVDAAAPEIVSVRVLATREGYDGAFYDLEALTLPMPAEQSELQSDFGAPDAARQLSELPPAFTTK